MTHAPDDGTQRWRSLWLLTLLVVLLTASCAGPQGAIGPDDNVRTTDFLGSPSPPTSLAPSDTPSPTPPAPTDAPTYLTCADGHAATYLPLRRRVHSHLRLLRRRTRPQLRLPRLRVHRHLPLLRRRERRHLRLLRPLEPTQPVNALPPTSTPPFTTAPPAIHRHLPPLHLTGEPPLPSRPPTEPPVVGPRALESFQQDCEEGVASWRSGQVVRPR